MEHPLLGRLDALLTRLEQLVPGPPEPPDFSTAVAFRWQRNAQGARLLPVTHTRKLQLADLQGIEEQRARLEQNTRQFLAGYPANHALLWGARGTGKSSLIKALLTEHAERGLRVIEVDKHELVDLPLIVELIAERPERFIVFCDDLSFEAGDPTYKTLKVVLDGSMATPTDNLIVYATSNRRHLMPEYMAENLEAHRAGQEIHQGESVEEKVALSDRFGLWLSFYPFDQDQYLAIVRHWLERLGAGAVDQEAVRREALQWALARGGRSGRTAWQFARDWVGRAALR